MIQTFVVTTNDNLEQLVAEINSAVWDDQNDMCAYDVASLTAYLNRQDTLFVTCHELHSSTRVLLGFASARVELKPYNDERWLYVDELDVCANQRKRGAGTAIMRQLFELAQDAGCEELWLGTEVDNKAANALYKSLNPDDVARVVGYTYEFDE